MSNIDENEIRRRLERISRIEPKAENSTRAIERVREALADQRKSGAGSRQGLRRIFAGPVRRFAAAAVLLIAAGYLAGRISSPRPPDMQQLEAALERRLSSSVEAAIRKNLLDELNRDWQSALAEYHAKLSNEFGRFTIELGERQTSEMNEFAAKTLAASSTVTHRLLNDLVQAIATAQVQDRQWAAAAMRRIESNRIQDITRLNVGFAALAEQTRGELTKTKQGLAQLYSVVSPDGAFPDAEEHQQPQ